MRNVIIIGSRGYKSRYGGWETFVTELIKNYPADGTNFYIPSLNHEKKRHEEVIDGVKVKNIHVPKQGFVTMFTFTILAVLYYTKYIKKKQLKNVTMYILGCKVGPLFTLLHRKLKKLGVTILINPDGLEWKREKWAWWIKQCFKISEHEMIKASDYVICDSLAIERYVKNKYGKYHVKTLFIPYGAYLNDYKDINKETKKFMDQHKIIPNNYYLIVGRFVPENNYQLMIKEFMKSDTKKDLVIISNVEKNRFYKKLLKETKFDQDKRIKFVGSIYEEDVLRRIRKYATAYIHGHKAGGTNPSLLEALSITDVNILYNAVYNIEVGKGATLYFSDKENSLTDIIKEVDKFKEKDYRYYGVKAKKRITDDYTWEDIALKYQKLFKLTSK